MTILRADLAPVQFAVMTTHSMRLCICVAAAMPADLTGCEAAEAAIRAVCDLRGQVESVKINQAAWMNQPPLQKYMLSK